ncbi:hypothetical protein GFK04_23380, partial [Salmonella enterica subsp. enterica serovar Enteritidis]|nr:hypothetical protein [Salmonella enterica subsp. enterica serovar Enteritidis]
RFRFYSFKFCFMFGKGNIEYRTSIVQMQGINFWQPIVYGIIITIIMPFLSRAIEFFHLKSDRYYLYSFLQKGLS